MTYLAMPGNSSELVHPQLILGAGSMNWSPVLPESSARLLRRFYFPFQVLTMSVLVIEHHIQTENPHHSLNHLNHSDNWVTTYDSATQFSPLFPFHAGW